MEFFPDISIHAPQWGATSPIISRPSILAVFQSTHPSGVRPAHLIMLVVSEISIHAPQWGATGLYGQLAAERGISIHAPQWGATVQIACRLG